MTQQEIIEMAKEVGLGFVVDRHWMCHDELEAFAKLVAAKERERVEDLCMRGTQLAVLVAKAEEREACEAVCNKLSANKPDEPTSFDFRYGAGCCAQAIRARGQT